MRRFFHDLRTTLSVPQDRSLLKYKPTVEHLERAWKEMSAGHPTYRTRIASHFTTLIARVGALQN